MKKLRLVPGCLLPALAIPLAASAQSADDTTSFTSHAMVIGFLVLSVIVLVFLGLMLKARVNELKHFIRKTTVKKPESALQEMMRLDEEELNRLMEKRQQGRGQTSPASQSPDR